MDQNAHGAEDYADYLSAKPKTDPELPLYAREALELVRLAAQADAPGSLDLSKGCPCEQCEKARAALTKDSQP